jgi:sugar phosphate permease
MLFGAFTHAGGLDLPVLGHLPAWRATFLSLALPGIGLAAIIWLILREPERVFTASRTKPSPTSVVRHLWAEKQYFLAAFAAYLCFAIIINAFLAWGPTYLIREARMSPAETGRNFGAIMLASGIAGPLLFGWVADLLAKRWSPLMALRGLALVFIGIAGVTWLTFMQGRPNETLWVIAFLSVLVTGPPILATISIQMFTPGHMRGQVSAFSSLLGYVFGVTVGTMGVPLLSTKWAAGLGNAIGIVVIAAASLGAIACLLARAIKAPVEQQSSP